MKVLVPDERPGDLHWLRATATDVLSRCLDAPVALAPPELIREGGRSVAVRCGVNAQEDRKRRRPRLMLKESSGRPATRAQMGR